MWGEVERAAYLLQHSLCVFPVAGDREATVAVFIGSERRSPRSQGVGEKSYALCAMDARWMRGGSQRIAADRSCWRVMRAWGDRDRSPVVAPRAGRYRAGARNR